MKNLVLTLCMLLCLLAAAAAPAAGDEIAPVKRIDVYVLPYYQAAETPEGRPHVAVGKTFDDRLASNRKEDILAVRDDIRARPQRITPMTLMVLAIRLYDMGLRDEAVFWFYVAKDRYATVAAVLDVASPALAQVEDAVRNFATLAGPVFNGYAFCDVARQRETSDRALAWVEQNPYEALFMEQLPALPGDRRENLKKAILRLRDNAGKERQYLADPSNLAAFTRKRRENHAEEQFCWKP